MVKIISLPDWCRLPLFRDSIPCGPKGSPLWYLLRNPFLKAPWAPKYTNFEGERAPKNRDFLVKIFQKVPKNAFLDYFFQKLARGAENLPKTGTKPCLGRAQKINSVGLEKKCRQNFRKTSKIFLKIRTPSRKS